MFRIFLSHSSKDNFATVAIGAWLKEEGWDDAFLDLDPAHGIHPGQRWERALYDHASDCEAVILLVSRNWLASDWCRREHDLARKLNKRVFVVLIDDIPIAELPDYLSEMHQAVTLAAGEDHRVFNVTMPVTHEQGHVTFSREGLARLKYGLTEAGLDARFFAWPPANDPDRAPYRGLEPLDGVDAGVFFGRDGPIIEALDALRGLREAANPRLFVILGASGAGKSSFVRAGLLPRLARDDRNFLTLPIIRPERAAISGPNGLVAAIAAAAEQAKIPLARANIREAVEQGADRSREILRQLSARPGAAVAPAIVLAIDQAEELFRPEGLAEGEKFLTLLRDLASVDNPPIVAAFVIRTDAYDALERAKSLEGIPQRTFALLPMPRGAYQTVIEGPAKRLAQSGRKFEIDPGLTQALLHEIEQGGGSDALPLLAFTLEQLYRDHAAAGKITRENFDKFEGLKGAIDAAVGRALADADKDGRIPRDPEARSALLRRGLIPWLAGVDPETKTVRRRIARAAQIPEEARPLIGLLVEQRLLTRDTDKETGEATIEPAHEALLRQWGGLKGWLEEDFGRLVTLEGVKRASRDWDANARRPAWAAHGGARLEEAEKLDERADLAALLYATDRAYFAACREKDKSARETEEARLRAEAQSARNARRAALIATIGAVVSLGLAALAGAAALYGRNQAHIAGEQRLAAEMNAAGERQSRIAAQTAQSQFLGHAARQALDAGNTEKGILLGLAGLPDELHRKEGLDSGVAMRTLDLSLLRPYPALAVKASEKPLTWASFSPDGARFVTGSHDKLARIWESRTGAALVDLEGHEGVVFSANFSPDASKIVTASRDRTVRIWDSQNGKLLKVLTGHTDDVNYATFSPDGKKVASVSQDGTVRIWNAITGILILSNKPANEHANFVIFNATGHKVLVTAADVFEIDASTGQLLRSVKLESSAATAVYYRNENYVLTSNWDGSAELWNIQSSKRQSVFRGHEALLWTAFFDRSGERLITSSQDGTARIWDRGAGTALAILKGPDGYVYCASFSPDGRQALVANFDGTAEIWDLSSLNGGGGVLDLDKSGGAGGGGLIISERSPDNARIALAFADAGSEVSIVDTNSGREIATARGHGNRVVASVFTRDGSKLLTASWDKTARLWRTTDGALLNTFAGHAGALTSVALSLDETLVATSSNDSTARVWNVRDGAKSLIVVKHRDESTVNSVAFSPKGDMIVTAASDTTARVWNAESGRELFVLEHAKDVNSALFSPDGKTIVTACNDGRVRIWSGETGAFIKEFDRQIKNERAIFAEFNSESDKVVVTYGLNPFDIQTSRRTVVVFDVSSLNEMTIIDNGDELLWYQVARFVPGRSEIRYVTRKEISVVKSVPKKLLGRPDRIIYASAVSRRKLTDKEASEAFLVSDEANGIREASPDNGPECDRLAGSPYDNRNPFKGTLFGSIVPSAIDVCRKAVQEYPSEPRYKFALARALQQHGNHKDAYQLYENLASQDYPAAHHAIGVYLLGDLEIKEDRKAALEHFMRAAKLGFSFSYGTLAQLHMNDNPQEALKWAMQGVETAGCPHCDYFVADYLREGGAEIRKDPGKSIFLFSRALIRYEDLGEKALAETVRSHRAALARSMEPETVVVNVRRAIQTRVQPHSL